RYAQKLAKHENAKCHGAKQSIPLIQISEKFADAFASVLFFFGGVWERTAGSNMSVFCSALPSFALCAKTCEA
ncbi:MAG: hypothetical protein MJ085_03350, partial [Clostridia bacterium]|nr:hypothetical protein [Clostridia bacterium]